MALVQIQSALLLLLPPHALKINYDNQMNSTPKTPSPLGIVTNEMIVRPAAGEAIAFEQYAPASIARHQIGTEGRVGVMNGAHEVWLMRFELCCSCTVEASLQDLLEG